MPEQDERYTWLERVRWFLVVRLLLFAGRRDPMLMMRLVSRFLSKRARDA